MSDSPNSGEIIPGSSSSDDDSSSSSDSGETTPKSSEPSTTKNGDIVSGSVPSSEKSGAANTKAKKGDTVHIHYTGRLQDGTVFDSSREREPISFELGAQKVIPGFEKLVEGMEPGDTKTGTITPEDGYGERRDDMVMDVDRESLPDEIEPEVGQQLQMHTQQGQAVPVQIAKVEDDHITVDANHPLAGRTLEFDVELVEIEDGDGESSEGGNIITP